jgi:hypothetical protein
MNENAARIDWAGVGVRLPRRFTTPRSIGLAVERALADDDMRARVGALAAWHRGERSGRASRGSRRGVRPPHALRAERPFVAPIGAKYGRSARRGLELTPSEQADYPG